MSRFAAILAIGLLALPAAATAQSAQLCTGLGKDARDEAAAFPHTLKLVFAARSGAYVGDVAVKVESGGTAVFDGVCDGPWLLLNLDAGRYRVTATFEGQTSTFDAQVGSRPTERTVVFRTAE